MKSRLALIVMVMSFILKMLDKSKEQDPTLERIHSEVKRIMKKNESKPVEPTKAPAVEKAAYLRGKLRQEANDEIVDRILFYERERQKDR